MKEQPCDRWAKEHKSRPYLGLMASEGGQREEALTEHGCNYFGKGVIRSAPFAPFLRQDLLQLALDLKAPVPEIYGTIERRPDGNPWYTTRGRSGPGVACADLAYTWRRDHIGLTGSGYETRKSGSFGCIAAVRTQRLARNSVGDGYWITSALSGRIYRME